MAAGEEQYAPKRLWLKRCLAGILALAAATGGFALLICSIAAPGGFDPEPLATAGRGRRLRSKEGGEDLVHVCLTTDDTDLRSAAVAIQSALASASDPSRLRFHLVVADELVTLFKEVIKNHLPDVPVDIRHSSALQKRIHSFISLRDTSRARRALASPFNFAPFYLHDFLAGSKKHKLNAKRIIYIDTDSVVLGDLAELHDMDLQGHPVAAVKDCSQRWEDYIDFEVLQRLGFTSYTPQACITQRAVFVYDVQKWVKKDMTGKIEEWMDRYRKSKEDLWFDGMALPPWMLAVGDDYLALGEEWDCDDLGHESMSIPQSQLLRKNGFDYKAFKTLGVQFSEYGRIQPYVATCSATAKLLHFNGGMRPWLLERFGKMPPTCAMPVSLQAQQWKWSRNIKVYCEASMFVACPEIWWKYISEETACALKDFDKEWQDDEERWTDHKMDDEEAKRAAEREAREKMSLEEQEKLQREEERLRERRRDRFRFHWGSEEALSKRKKQAKEKENKDAQVAEEERLERERQEQQVAEGSASQDQQEVGGEGDQEEEDGTGDEEVDEEVASKDDQQ